MYVNNDLSDQQESPTKIFPGEGPVNNLCIIASRRGFEWAKSEEKEDDVR
jgi:hypothetical protein